jgi:hypothetical protein
MNVSVGFLCTPQHLFGREIKHLFKFSLNLTALVALRLQEKDCVRKTKWKLEGTYILDIYCQNTPRALCSKRLTLA